MDRNIPDPLDLDVELLLNQVDAEKEERENTGFSPSLADELDRGLTLGEQSPSELGEEWEVVDEMDAQDPRTLKKEGVASMRKVSENKHIKVVEEQIVKLGGQVAIIREAINKNIDKNPNAGRGKDRYSEDVRKAVSRQRINVGALQNACKEPLQKHRRFFKNPEEYVQAIEVCKRFTPVLQAYDKVLENLVLSPSLGGGRISLEAFNRISQPFVEYRMIAQSVENIVDAVELQSIVKTELKLGERKGGRKTRRNYKKRKGTRKGRKTRGKKRATGKKTHRIKQTYRI